MHELSYFADMYAGDDDPWGFDDRWYERRKYALTVAMLPDPRYRRALEPGCANGALSELLAPRCEELHSFDMLPGPAARAADRLADQAHVHVTTNRFPGYWPPGTGDLVVWSEVAYYLDAAEASVAVAGLDRWLEPDGTLIAVHWTGDTNYPRTGRDVARALDRVSFLQRRATHRDTHFEAAVWQRVP